MESVEEICEEIALINKGEKILSGKLRDIKAEYKANIFQVELEDHQQISTLEKADILEQAEEDGMLRLRLSSKNGNSNAVVKELMQHGTLVSFREEIPSLNDIFIQKVQN